MSKKHLLQQKGFTLIEMLVVMAIFGFVIAITASTFSLIINKASTQGKVAETQIERIIGVETLRQDIEAAGIGLPWSFQMPISYQEAASSTVCGGAGINPQSFNDSPSDVPRAIVSANDSCINNSDYLVIRGATTATNDASQAQYSYIQNGVLKNWASGRTIPSGSLVTVIAPKPSETATKRMVMANSTSFSTTFDASFSNTMYPDANDYYIIYGITPSSLTLTALRMPFNRTDYYITTTGTPLFCAAGTGVLTKFVIAHADGVLRDATPIMDCVADMQIAYRFDMNSDGTIETVSNANGSSVSGATLADVQATMADPELIRQRLKEVRVYILSHEGQRDRNFTYPNNSILVGEMISGINTGQSFNLTNIADYQRFRWKVTTLIINPKNIAN